MFSKEVVKNIPADHLRQPALKASADDELEFSA
jgi:hypothetical protein